MATPQKPTNPSTEVRRKPVVSFAEKPSIKILRRIIPIAARIAPKLTAKYCLQLFLTPGRKKRPDWEAAHLAKSRIEEIHIEGQQVTVYRWGISHQRILLCHAWGGRGTQLGDFILPLVQSGYEVVAFDAPGHGDSGGVRTDMVEYARVIAELAHRFGPLRAVIGHSFGAGNTVYAMHQYGVIVDRVVLVGCFSDGEWVINRFGELLNIPATTLSSMKSAHERRHNQTISWAKSFKISDMAGKIFVPTLIVHDEDDFEIPYVHAQNMIKVAEGRHRLISTNKLGHRRIIRNEPVIRAVCEFIVEGR